MRGYATITGAVLLAVAAGSARADVIRITIDKLVFSPAQVSAHVGDTVEWVNRDFLAHSATARNGAFDVDLPPNASRRLVLTSPGAVEYFCKFHPNMTGRIRVAK